MDSTTAKVLFVAALFAGVAGMVIQSGVAMERGMGLDEMPADQRFDLESSGSTVLTLSAGLFGMSLFASKRSHRSAHPRRPRVVSITIPVPSGARSTWTQPRPAAAPPPPPPRPVVSLPVGPSNYVSVVETPTPIDELIASCTAIRLDPPLQKVGGVPMRRSAGRYR